MDGPASSLRQRFQIRKSEISHPGYIQNLLQLNTRQKLHSRLLPRCGACAELFADRRETVAAVFFQIPPCISIVITPSRGKRSPVLLSCSITVPACPATLQFLRGGRINYTSFWGKLQAAASAILNRERQASGKSFLDHELR